MRIHEGQSWSSDRRSSLRLGPATNFAIFFDVDLYHIRMTANGAIFNVLLLRSCRQINRDNNVFTPGIANVAAIVVRLGLVGFSLLFSFSIWFAHLILLKGRFPATSRSSLSDLSVAVQTSQRQCPQWVAKFGNRYYGQRTNLWKGVRWSPLGLSPTCGNSNCLLLARPILQEYDQLLIYDAM